MDRKVNKEGINYLVFSRHELHDERRSDMHDAQYGSPIRIEDIRMPHFTDRKRPALRTCAGNRQQSERLSFGESLPTSVVLWNDCICTGAEMAHICRMVHSKAASRSFGNMDYE
jgi:hypothetical protein